MNKTRNASGKCMKDIIQTKDAKCIELLGCRSAASEIMGIIKNYAKLNFKKKNKYEAILSAEWLAWKTGFSESCIRKNIKKLKKHSFIETRKIRNNQAFNRDNIFCNFIFTPFYRGESLND